jgi:hypothetical protein
MEELLLKLIKIEKSTIICSKLIKILQLFAQINFQTNKNQFLIN